jgi:hypothetical protein
MEMYGNGVRIIGMKTIKGHRSMGVLGLQAETAIISCCAAVRGTTIPGTVGLPSASATLPAFGTTISVFGWFAVWREDFLALCSLALFPSALFSLPSPARSA